MCGRSLTKRRDWKGKAKVTSLYQGASRHLKTCLKNEQVKVSEQNEAQNNPEKKGESRWSSKEMFQESK